RARVRVRAVRWLVRAVRRLLFRLVRVSVGDAVRRRVRRNDALRPEDEASRLECDVEDRRSGERPAGSAGIRRHDHRRDAKGRRAAGAEVIATGDQPPALQRTSAAHAPSVRLRWVVPALGVAQIISWGSLYYPIAVLAAPIREELGIGNVAVFGSFTAGLFASGFAAPM